MGLFSSPSAAAIVFKQTLEPVGWQDGDLWVDLNENPPIIRINDNGTATTASTFAKVIKTADETRASDSDLTDDAVLTFTPTISKTYTGILYLYIVSAATPDFKYDFTIPTGSTFIRLDGPLDPTTADFTQDESVQNITTSNTTQRFLVIPFDLIMSTTAGTLDFRWAQQTPNAANTTVKAGSTLLVWEG